MAFFFSCQIDRDSHNCLVEISFLIHIYLEIRKPTFKSCLCQLLSMCLCVTYFSSFHTQQWVNNTTLSELLWEWKETGYMNVHYKCEELFLCLQIAALQRAAAFPLSSVSPIVCVPARPMDALSRLHPGKLHASSLLAGAILTVISSRWGTPIRGIAISFYFKANSFGNSGNVLNCK